MIEEKIYDESGNVIKIRKYKQGPFLGKGGFARVY